MVKSDAELGLIRHAAEVGVGWMRTMMEAVEPGRTEGEVVGEGLAYLAAQRRLRLRRRDRLGLALAVLLQPARHPRRGTRPGGSRRATSSTSTRGPRSTATTPTSCAPRWPGASPPRSRRAARGVDRDHRPHHRRRPAAGVTIGEIYAARRGLDGRQRLRRAPRRARGVGHRLRQPLPGLRPQLRRRARAALDHRGRADGGRGEHVPGDRGAARQARASAAPASSRT